MKHTITLFISLCLIVQLAVAQSSFQLLDAHSGAPIVSAFYSYGQDQGISDAEGRIIFYSSRKKR